MLLLLIIVAKKIVDHFWKMMSMYTFSRNRTSWGAWEKFKVSLQSWQRGSSPLFYEEPPYCSNFVHHPPQRLCPLQPPPPTILSVLLFPWLNG